MAQIRSRFYEAGALKVVDTGVSVISVGNLTAGGTGKTPVTSFLADVLASRGFDCAIISRGYGALVKGPAFVDSEASPESARRFGDEPSWLASEHRDVPVIVGGRRPESIAFLLASSSVSSMNPAKAFVNSTKRVVIADDAFQHRRLKRQIDIVILDATEPRWHYHPLPLGRLREGFDALGRASFIFISKTNLANREQLAWLREMIRSTSRTARVIDFGVRLNGFVPLESNRAVDKNEAKPNGKASDLKERRIVLVSGIARPQTFEQLVQETAPAARILKHFIFRDHYSYRADDLQSIEREARELGAEAIVVTEKDATKLGAWRPQIACYVSRLVARPLSNFGDFYEALDRLV